MDLIDGRDEEEEAEEDVVPSGRLEDLAFLDLDWFRPVWTPLDGCSRTIHARRNSRGGGGRAMLLVRPLL
jgi:hypothetical protein